MAQAIEEFVKEHEFTEAEQDQMFKEELNRRLGDSLKGMKIVEKNKGLISKTIKETVDSMIKDKIMGPMFHQEIKTDVTLDKDTGMVHINFEARLGGIVRNGS